VQDLLTKAVKFFLSVFGRLETIPHDDPDLTPENWCQKQPCLRICIGSREVIISQPLSSFWVYFLGLFTVAAGFHFFLTQHGENSRFWWGISLVLWGVGALLAGTSYQAFGYELKCAGRKECSWTSWWEVIYLILQQLSINAMLVAIAYSCTTGIFQKVLFGYSLATSLIYCLLVCIGSIVPVKSLLTFEFMLLFSAPVCILSPCFSAWHYFMFNGALDLVLLGSWLLLFGSMIAYWIYRQLGLTKKLWLRGVWFSDNDVLHVLLIVWVFYLLTAVAGRIEDYTIPAIL